MKLVNLSTGQPEEVPDDQAQAAFQSKTHGFADPSQPVPVKLKDGRVGTVPAAQAHDAFASGATIASQDEYHAAVNEKKYGGVAGGLEAGAEGLARGLTVGLSDPLAIAAAKAIGGKEGAQAAREHLAGVKEAHPYVAGASEIVGAAAPVLATGGAAAPEELAARGAAEGAEAATAAREVAQAAPAAPGRMQALLKAVGAPARGVAGAGEVAGRAAESVLGAPGAGGAMARIAKAAAKAGVTGATEGGLFGAGNEISEDVLGDHQLNAEKLAAAVGHGALFGAMTGGVLGGAGQAAREVGGTILNKIAPGIERQADTEAFKSLHPKLGLTKEAIARAGGEQAVGGTVRKFNLLGESMAEAATSEPETILARTKKAQDEVGQQINDLVSKSDATVKASEVLEPLQKRIAELEETAGGKQISGQLRKFRDELAESLGAVETRVPRSSAEIGQWLKENPGQFTPGGGLPEAATVKIETANPDIPIAKLVQERRALQDIVYKQAKSLTPALHIDELRDFAGSMNRLEEKALNDASAELGGEDGTKLRALSKDYQRLKLIEKSQMDRVATQATNQRLSLTDKMFAASHVAGALASGHPLGALAAAGTAMGSKFLREKGNAMASVALGRLAKLDIVARAAQKVDGELDGAFERFAASKPGPAKIRLRHFGAPSDASVQERYDKAREGVPPAPSSGVRLTAEHADRAIPGLAEHAPKTAGALGDVMSTGAAYLSAQHPKAPGGPSFLGREARPSEAQMSAYVRQREAVEDPVGTVSKALETGKVHNDQIKAIQASKPQLYAQIQQQAIDTVAKHGKSLDYNKVMTLSKIAQMPFHPSLTPKGVAYSQSTFLNPTGVGGAAPGKAPRGAPKRQITGIADANRLSTGDVIR